MKNKVSAIVSLCAIGLFFLIVLIFFVLNLVTQPEGKDAMFMIGLVLGLLAGVFVGVALPEYVEALQKEKKSELPQTQGEQPPQL